MFKSTSTSLILLGVLAVIVGIIAFAWPGVTVYALVILFAVYAFVLFARPNVGAVTLALLFGLFSIVYGVSRITLGVQLHQLHKEHQSALPPSALHTAA